VPLLRRNPFAAWRWHFIALDHVGDGLPGLGRTSNLGEADELFQIQFPFLFLG
jgi:hypothetical protein